MKIVLILENDFSNTEVVPPQYKEIKWEFFVCLINSKPGMGNVSTVRPGQAD